MSQKTVEQRVQDVLDEILRNHAMEEAFCPAVDHSSPLMAFNKQLNINKIKNLCVKLAEESKDSVDIALKAFVGHIYRAKSDGRIGILCDTLVSLVESNTIPPKSICDVLLAHEHLDVDHPLHWNATFRTIRKIIGGVDYKGVRDMLKIFLEKCQAIDKMESRTISFLPQLKIITETISYVIDRNACLMPAYFAIYELLKVFPTSRKWPHWLGKTLDGLVTSFRPSAQMVSIAGRSSLLPVVGHSMAVSNVWRLNSSTLSFQLSGPLPYDAELLEPQHGLLRYVLEQTYSRELVCTMLGLNKQGLVEETYSRELVCTMLGLNKQVRLRLSGVGVGGGSLERCGVGEGSLERCGVGEGSVERCGVGEGLVERCGGGRGFSGAVWGGRGFGGAVWGGKGFGGAVWGGRGFSGGDLLPRTGLHHAGPQQAGEASTERCWGGRWFVGAVWGGRGFFGAVGGGRGFGGAVWGGRGFGGAVWGGRGFGERCGVGEGSVERCGVGEASVERCGMGEGLVEQTYSRELVCTMLGLNKQGLVEQTYSRKLVCTMLGLNKQVRLRWSGVGVGGGSVERCGVEGGLIEQCGVGGCLVEQTYSRELVCTMLGLIKQAKLRCEALETQLVDLVVTALERCETEVDVGAVGGGGGMGVGEEVNPSQLHWQHLSSQLIFFVLFQFASFSHMVNALYEKLKGKRLRKGRDHLMWVLLQFISGSIQKNPITDFLPVLKLYDLLYDDKEVIPVPDITKASATHALASTCIWIHLNKKAENDKLSRPIPYGLREHQEFLKQTLTVKTTISTNDYKIALLCNAYSTDTEYFARPMGHLLESIYGNQKSTTLLPGNIVASAPTQPLSMNLLDSLTVHAKMSLIHSIVTRVIKLAKQKSTTALAPALVETYSRLLVYMEIESLGIKGFISQLLPTVVEHHALGILHTLLEMFSYRLHHTQIHYRVQLLSHLYTLASIQQANQNQLHLCVESTALRLITSLGSAEVQPQLSRILTEPKGSPQNILAGESEELNRALVLTLARAVEITGQDSFPMAWCKDILTSIHEHTPIAWSSATMQYLPTSLAEFYREKAPSPENKAQLKSTVDAEYAKWRSMGNDNDIIAHFTMLGTPPLFLCIICKNILDENRVPSVAYKVLDRLGPRALSSHLRRFCDYLAFELANSTSQVFGRYFEALSDMMWKYNILAIDRFFLCLVLRNLEDTEGQVRFLLIQYLITRSEFKSRVVDFVRENSPEHWRQSNWHEKHMAFHRAYPEKFYYEGIQDLNMPIQHQYLPVYFGNVCLRFIPVFDLMIHRLLEPVQVVKVLDAILDHIGCLYKFHDHPITYLYNTLFYYEKRLSPVPLVKRRLVSAIIGAFKEIRPPNWCLSEEYKNYLQQPADTEVPWNPDHDYYIHMVSRLVNTINGKQPPPFPHRDWRFNEFPNAAAHALHATCVELMALPVPGQVVGSALLDVVLRSSSQVPHDKLMDWMNAVGLILTALPESYWVVLNERIVSTITSAVLAAPSPDMNPFRMFGFSTCHSMLALTDTSQLLGLCHGVWHHAGIGQLSHLPQFVREQLQPVIKTEEQLLFLCHLIGPFLQRFHLERTRCLMELTVELYEILVKVDKHCEHMKYINPICDYLYHIKYMFVGDGVKNEVEKLNCNLRPSLRMRLRFISHINVDEMPEQQQR
ncbi:hypothetical protein ACOMHN_043912 [Nucella lapillus]